MRQLRAHLIIPIVGAEFSSERRNKFCLVQITSSIHISFVKDSLHIPTASDDGNVCCFLQ